MPSCRVRTGWTRSGIPPSGSTMGVGDAVELVIETEFTGPPLPKVTVR